MKNVLFGVLTLALLLGISAIAVSPQLTELFVDVEPIATTNDTPENHIPSWNAESILQMSGTQWEALSYEEQMAFIIELVEGLETRKMESIAHNQLLQKIDTYYQNNSKNETVEKAVMTILHEHWSHD